MPVVIPAVVNVPIPADSLDDTIAANRAALIAVGNQGNALETALTALTGRVTTLESRPSTPTPVVTIPVPASVETSLNSVAVGSVAILRGPSGVDFIVQRV